MSNINTILKNAPIFIDYNIKDFNEKLLVNYKNVYREIKVLGAGGFGEVILVEQIDNGQMFALKFIDLTKVSIRTALEEYKNTKLVNKYINNIPIFYDKFLVYRNEKHYLVNKIEYLVGKDLHGSVFKTKKKLNRNIFIYIFITLCNTVKILHSYNIIHRDLKIENVFISNNELILIDFGLTCYRYECEKYLIGTSYYFSPEYNKANKSVSDEQYLEILKRYEIWAIGTMMYELTQFREPFKESDIERKEPLVFVNKSIFNKLIQEILDRYRNNESMITLDEIILRLSELYE